MVNFSLLRLAVRTVSFSRGQPTLKLRRAGVTRTCPPKTWPACAKPEPRFGEGRAKVERGEPAPHSMRGVQCDFFALAAHGYSERPRDQTGSDTLWGTQ